MSNYKTINYDLIRLAILQYKYRGYQYMEVPWMVSREAIGVTFMGECLKHYKLEAVGSAEQSFIQMMLDGTLLPGKYVAATPCFRMNESEDELHQKTFFKVELINYFGENAPIHNGVEVENVLSDAEDFFKSNIFITSTKPIRENTNQGIDLTLNGIEIGSYGVRSYLNHNWVYGTGIAEPRFSYAAGL